MGISLVQKKVFMVLFSVILFLMMFITFISENKASAASYSFRDKSTWAWVGTGYSTSGGFVGAVQSDLWASGYSGTVGTVDRTYGSKTNTAVKSFQSKYGLTADGTVGTGTWAKFEEYTYDIDSWTRLYTNPSGGAIEVDYKLHSTGTGSSFDYYLVNKSTGQTYAQGNIWSE